MSESLATRLEATVRRLSSDIGERHFRRAHALDEALSFIREELERSQVPSGAFAVVPEPGQLHRLRQQPELEEAFCAS